MAWFAAEDEDKEDEEDVLVGCGNVVEDVCLLELDNAVTVVAVAAADILCSDWLAECDEKLSLVDLKSFLLWTKVSLLSFSFSVSNESVFVCVVFTMLP